MKEMFKITILLGIFALTQGNFSWAQGAVEPTVSAKPNIVFVIADDMRADDMEYMPKTQALLGGQGETFNNAFVSHSLCCPSRTTMLRGQYTHNHGVLTNRAREQGGLGQFNSLNRGESTIATWLDAAGYDTGLFGKYLNGCAGCPRPPGWDNWQPNTAKHANTDQTFDKADAYVNTHDFSTPAFMWIAPRGPHAPLAWPNAYDGMYSTTHVPRTPSINEGDLSDKPGYVRSHDKVDMGEQDKLRRGRARMVAQIDDRVAQLASELDARGQLENTYLVFTSDNGFMQGEHRLGAKQVPYEESIRVPLLMRGPGIQPSTTSDKLAVNIDVAPTFAQLGGAPTPDFVDGRSLVPLLAPDGGASQPWRSRFLIEHYHLSQRPTPTLHGVRTENSKYIQYPQSGFQEFHDLSADPYELEAQHTDNGLQPVLDALKVCSGQSCRDAEDQ